MEKSLVDIICESFSGFDRSCAENFVSKCPENILRVGDSLCLFFDLDDSTLNQILNRRRDLLDINAIPFLLKQKGGNIHVFGLASKRGSDVFRMRQYFKGKKSISWFTPDMKRFVYFERS